MSVRALAPDPQHPHASHGERPPKPQGQPFTQLPQLPGLEALRGFKQWVAWDYVWKPEKAKWDKPPFSPRGGFASSSAPDTWGSYDEAAARARAERLAGVGFVLSPDDDLTGVDLDKCRNAATGVLEPWAAEIIALAETYAEVSPSGAGVRLFMRGKIASAIKCDPAHVEIYPHGRYLTVTGRHIPGTPTEIRPAPRTLEALTARVAAIKADMAAEKERSGQNGSRIAFNALHGQDFFQRVNRLALDRLSAWVPALFGSAAKPQPGTQGYRVSSRALGRDLEEDLSVTPMGIVDFGVHDLGDARDGKRTAIDLVMEHGDVASAADAALWLCDRMGLDPGALGWRSRAGSSQSRQRSANKAAKQSDSTGPTPPSNDIVTEDSAAQRFAECYRDRLRFCHDTGSWFEYDGMAWRQNKTGVAFAWARKLARELSEDEPTKVRYLTSKTSFASGVERFARSDEAFAVTAEAWDSDPLLLGTPGGTVDLRTGRLRPSDPADGITKLTAVTPAERAACPLWLKFLDEATGGDAELVQFLRQWSGYALTGLTREHALVFVYGPGGNGKSVFLNVLTGILHDYAATAAMDTFTASKGEKHPTDLAMLRGARLVTASETEDGHAWAESRIKQMTGGDPITARFMRQDYFTYRPSFKLTIVGNHRPVLRNVDEAARRRFNIVPFTRKPAHPDQELEEKLRAEWPGILRWMIDGCVDWQAQGLVRPSSVVEETNNYFTEQDLLGQWLAEKCDCEPGNSHKTATNSELWKSWAEFAKAAGEVAGSQKTFADQMQRRGLERWRAHGGVRGFRGVRIKPPPSQDSDG